MRGALALFLSFCLVHGTAVPALAQRALSTPLEIPALPLPAVSQAQPLAPESAAPAAVVLTLLRQEITAANPAREPALAAAPLRAAYDGSAVPQAPSPLPVVGGVAAVSILSGLRPAPTRRRAASPLTPVLVGLAPFLMGAASPSHDGGGFFWLSWAAAVGVAAVARLPEMPDFPKIRRAIIDYASGKRQLKETSATLVDRIVDRLLGRRESAVNYEPGRPAQPPIEPSSGGEALLAEIERHADAGRFEEADLAAQRLVHPLQKADAYGLIGARQFKIEIFESVEQMAAEQSREAVHDAMLARLVWHELQAGYRFFPKAQDTASKIHDQETRDAAFWDIVMEQAQAGQFALAQETSALIGGAQQRRQAAHFIHGQMARAARQKISESREIVDALKPEDREKISAAAAAAGDTLLAESLRALFPDPKPTPLLSVALPAALWALGGPLWALLGLGAVAAVFMSGGSHKKIGKRLGEFVGHDAKINHAAFSPSGERVATAGSDQTAVIWDARTGETQGRLTAMGHPLLALSWSTDEKEILGLGGLGELIWWNAESKAQAAWHFLPGLEKWGLRAGTLSQDGKAAGIDEQDNLLLWRGFREFPVPVSQAGRQFMAGVALSKNGRRLAATTRTGSVIVIDVETGRRLSTIAPAGNSPFTHASFDPSGEVVITVDADSTVERWRADDARHYGLVVKDAGAEPFSKADLSPDGERLVAYHDGHADVTASVWKTGSAPPLKILPGGKR